MDSVKPRDTLEDLEGWIAFPVAAERLKVSRQRFFQMAEEGKLKTARKIPGTGERPAAYVVREAEIDEMLRQQEAVGERAAERAAEDRASPEAVSP